MSSGSVSSWLSSRSSVWTRQRCVATCRVLSWLLASEISLKSNMCSVWYRRESSCADIHTREDKEKNSCFESVFRISVQSGHWICKKTGNSTKLELYHMASLKLLFLWTSILLKTACFMPNSIVLKIPQRESIKAFSSVKLEIQQKHKYNV